MTALAGIGGEERYWVHIPARKPRAYKNGGLVAAAKAVKGSPDANMVGDSELIHVNKYELEQLREMWGEPAINPETGLPAFGLFKTLGKIVKGVAKVAATVVLTPVVGPVAASAIVNAADTAISGGSLGDIAKSAGFAAATAGASQLGAKFAPSIGVSADVGRAIGAGLGATGAGVVTGQSFGDAAMGGLQAGIGTYGTNKMLSGAIRNNTLGIGDAYKGLTNIGYDIANATGIGGGGNYGVNDSIYGDDIRVTAPKGTSLTYTGSPNIGPVTSQTPSNQNFDYGRGGDTADQVVDENGNIIVTGGGTTNLTLGPGIPKITSGIGGEELQFDEEGNPIIVTGAGTNLTTVPGSATTDDKKYTPPGDEIVVNATGTNLTTVPGTTTVKEDVGVINPNGTITPLYPGMPATPATTEVPNLVPAAGRYTYTPLNRGLADIGFDPFTYGQAIEGGQPGEFLFFTQNGQPYGQVGRYTGPLLNRPAITPSGTPTAGIGDIGGGNLTLTDTGDQAEERPAIQTGGGVIATPENTGMTQERLDSLQDRYENMRSGEFFNYFKAVNDTLGTYVNRGYMTPAEAKAYQARLETAASTPKATLASLQAAVPMPQISDYLKPTGSRAESPAGIAAAAKIPEQLNALTAAPTSNLTAGQYYNQYVSPLAGSYFNSGKLNAEQARSLTNAAFPFIKTNDLAGAQSAVNAYLAQAGLAGEAPAMAEGGEANDDMVSHLIAYHKGGGHMGPGRVKGIGSGQEDKIPAWLSDGEYVWSAQDVADLGDGSTDEGVRRLDKMRQMVRQRAGRKDVKKIAKPQRGIDKMLKAVGGAV